MGVMRSVMGVYKKCLEFLQAFFFANLLTELLADSRANPVRRAWLNQYLYFRAELTLTSKSSFMHQRLSFFSSTNLV